MIKKSVCVSESSLRKPKLTLQYKAAIEGAEFEQKTFEPMNEKLPQTWIVGTHQDNDWILVYRTVSRKHCR